ncbi:MAG: DUF3492 domain-containing protein [Myxococcota bacterium]
MDVCIVAEGEWPAKTGGLSTWTNHVLGALRELEVGVVTVPSSSDLRYAVPSHVVVHRGFAGPLPRAKRYLASGLEAAEFVAAQAPAAQLVYVEHGDLVREVRSLGATEGGVYVPPFARDRAARDAADRRRRMVRHASMVVGVTRRTCRRALREGARAVCHVPNAVPPSLRAQRSKAIGFVGRCTRGKGIDRFLRLAERVDLPAMVTGLDLEASARLRPARVRWNLDAVDPWADCPGVIVMPSRLEASPFVALEAEARGIPVLLSDVADLDESALIQRRAWSLQGWAADAMRLALCPDVGSGAAHERWHRFETQWRGIAGGRQA